MKELKLEILKSVLDISNSAAKLIKIIDDHHGTPRTFSNESGTVVRWDGDLWLLDEDGDVLWPLGHTRCSRAVKATASGDTYSIYINDLEHM